MRTVTQTVREILSTSPFLNEVVATGMGNYAQIARVLRPQIERRLYEKVSDGTIAMALHRISLELKRPRFGDRFLKQLSDITVRSKMIEFVLPNTDALPPILEPLLKKLRNRKDVFIAFSQGVHESILVINAEFEKEFRTLVGKRKGIRKIERLSVITLRLPEASLDVPGVYYPILRALATEGISFIEIMSVNTELSIVCKDGDIDRAFATLKRITSSQ
ncbi:MAG TPA: hypothetical protein VG102_04030 [Candidatus Paceibacterota bacterium]|jgi:hypothetical protein|nr:hypothetical protein [Candidatus Paceibacterota bacterium]